VVGEVVGVGAVDHGHAARRGDGREAPPQLALAVVAARGRVGRVLGVVELAGVDLLERKPERGGDGARRRELVGGSDGLRPMTATARDGPSASSAAAARYVESTPPL
jgi:hypothetical protein